ncbi:MAG: MFS transporter [Lachnospiraceae bacterium]|nr:MFS transporter [Lachnospiraceae bacterium]
MQGENLQQDSAGSAPAVKKFGMLDNIAYAAGDFGCNMSFALKGTLVIFWTQFMQMDSILYAGLLLIVQIWDAINDPLVGVFIDADRRQYRLGKFKTYILIGSIGLIIAGALCFVPIPNAPAMAKNIIFIAGYVLWDAFYTIANVPYGSMLNLISADPGDRASLSAWRSIGALVGNILTMVLIPIIIYDSDNNIRGVRVFFLALVMGIIGFFAFQFMIKKTVLRVDEYVKVSEDRPKFNIFTAMKNFLTNRPAVGATLAVMGMFLGMQGAAAAVTVLFQSYFKNAQVSGIVSLFQMLPMLLFTPFIRKGVKRFGKKELSVVGAIVCVIACAGLLILPITPDSKGIAMYTVCQLINSLGMGIFSLVSWSMMADAIDYNEWKHNTREEGTIYSLHSFFRKLAQGFGPSIVLVIMVAVGYVEADRGNQTAQVAMNMRYLVAALYLATALIQLAALALVYNLDKTTLAQMESELEARRGAASSSQSSE